MTKRNAQNGLKPESKQTLRKSLLFWATNRVYFDTSDIQTPFFWDFFHFLHFFYFPNKNEKISRIMVMDLLFILFLRLSLWFVAFLSSSFLALFHNFLRTKPAGKIKWWCKHVFHSFLKSGLVSSFPPILSFSLSPLRKIFYEWNSIQPRLNTLLLACVIQVYIFLCC